MIKIKFPKEKEDIIRKLSEAKRLISESPDDAQILLEAFKIISECAEKGSARALFLKAAFLYADEQQTGDYFDEMLSTLNKAIKEKYPLAYGLKADYLLACEKYDMLVVLIRKAKDAPQTLYAEGGLLAGYCDLPKGIKRDFEKAGVCFEKAARLYLDYDAALRGGCDELKDITIIFRNPNYFSEQAGYCYQMLMSVYADEDVKANKERYLKAYENAQKYGTGTVKYKTAAARAMDSMDNVMGMHSLKTVNAALEKAKSHFAAFSEERRELMQEHYDKLWDRYEEFYHYETERLKAIGNMDVYSSPDYAKQDSLLTDLADAVNTWANTPRQSESTQYTVTIDNKVYRLNEHGEIVDEYGQSNGLRVDTTSKRVYDMHSSAVGFFDSFGEFHKY